MFPERAPIIKAFQPRNGERTQVRDHATACKCLKGSQLAGRHSQTSAPEKCTIILGVKSKRNLKCYR